MPKMNQFIESRWFLRGLNEFWIGNSQKLANHIIPTQVAWNRLTRQGGSGIHEPSYNCLKRKLPNKFIILSDNGSENPLALYFDKFSLFIISQPSWYEDWSTSSETVNRKHTTLSYLLRKFCRSCRGGVCLSLSDLFVFELRSSF